MLGDRPIPQSRVVNRPLYLQLRDALTERIASGEWKANAAIPNESDLARAFGVSAGTMRKALDLMETERLLTRRQGRGTFVNDPLSEELATRFCNIRDGVGRRVNDEITSGEVSEGEATETECARLRLRAGEMVIRVRRIRQENGQAYLAEDVSLPAALFPNFAKRTWRPGADRVIALAQEYGILLGRAQERIAIDAAPVCVARMLGVKAGTPIMVLDRVVLARDERPVEWRLAWCHLRDKCYMVEMV
jgi:GntR family transcriptional regulator